ncbi:MAG TPA: hypothetical protein VMY42_20885 [Thermoguttaceae bacterium]|nr:hypothetical protein [Thermoguttaceae bacterium]
MTVKTRSDRLHESVGMFETDAAPPPENTYDMTSIIVGEDGRVAADEIRDAIRQAVIEILDNGDDVPTKIQKIRELLTEKEKLLAAVGKGIAAVKAAVNGDNAAVVESLATDAMLLTSRYASMRPRPSWLIDKVMNLLESRLDLDSKLKLIATMLRGQNSDDEPVHIRPYTPPADLVESQKPTAHDLLRGDVAVLLGSY